MAIKDYSTTASSNTSLFPEGMNPSDVNNGMRQVQADIRTFYDTPQWRDLGNTVTYASATTFTISGNVTANYIANQRIRCYGSTMGTLYGSIVSSSYSAPNTTVTVTLDSGSLTSNLSAVALGVDPTNSPVPYQAVKGGVTLAGDNTFSGANTFSGTVSFTDTTLSSIRSIPQNSKSADYTLVLADGGKHILHPSADTTGRTFTIPANSSVAFPIGTAVTFVNQNSAGTITIAITTDTIRLSPQGTTGSRTLAANGMATALKVTSTEWIISGTGLT